MCYAVGAKRHCELINALAFGEVEYLVVGEAFDVLAVHHAFA